MARYGALLYAAGPDAQIWSTALCGGVLQWGSSNGDPPMGVLVLARGIHMTTTIIPGCVSEGTPPLLKGRRTGNWKGQVFRHTPRYQINQIRRMKNSISKRKASIHIQPMQRGLMPRYGALPYAVGPDAQIWSTALCGGA